MDHPSVFENHANPRADDDVADSGVPRRIVSLIASSTEILCALGLQERLVGRSHECDFPESVRALPQCTEPKFRLDGTSYQIDARIKAILQEGLSVYRVHAEKLRELAPDAIVTQVQCEVCAVSAREVEAAVCEMLGARPRILSLNPSSLSEIWSDIQRVADAMGVAERGQTLVAGLKSRVQSISSRAQALPERPTVGYVEWVDPLMSGGNWMPELVEHAGGRNLFGKAGAHSPVLLWEEVIGADPDVLFVSPCGFGIERTRTEAVQLTQKPGWKALKAVRENRVYVADANQYFTRPGPRVVESLESLAEILHPTVFHFGHEGKAWEIFEGSGP